jgi:hypothetical protein
LAVFCPRGSGFNQKARFSDSLDGERVERDFPLSNLCCRAYRGTFHACDLRFEINSKIPGIAMNHQQLEKDIEHLERVISHISAEDGIPLSYWRSRIDVVSGAVRVPAQASRIKRLNAALSALEMRQKA